MATNNAANQSSTGIQSLTSGGAFNGRTITGTANQVSITNGDGTAGNPTIALTSNIYVGGISFNSGTNILSAFTEGTWTPSITNSSTPPTGVSYVANGQVGRYSQIGNAICIEFRVALSAYTAGTGNVQFTTLPFTPANVANQNYVTDLNLSTVTFGASVAYYTGLITNNSTAITLIGTVSASTSYTALAADIAASSSFVLTGWFSIA
jgi:hypothetical protein